jgi:hypothetical protein
VASLSAYLKSHQASAEKLAFLGANFEDAQRVEKAYVQHRFFYNPEQSLSPDLLAYKDMILLLFLYSKEPFQAGQGKPVSLASIFMAMLTAQFQASEKVKVSA